MTNCPCDERSFSPALIIPAGLTSIPRQIATFTEFRSAMLAALGGKGPLSDWRARSSDDFGIMLLEMWAYICDSISFYDEVIAHEAYLRTSRLRPSLRKLVAPLGYIPSPAVSDSVDLAAFADGRQPVTLPAGTAFRSGAFAGNPPQVFELEAETTIHPFLNQWALALIRPATMSSSALFSQNSLLFRAGTARMEAEDVVLLQSPNGSKVLTVVEVGSFDGKDGESYTRVKFSSSISIAGSTPVSQVKVLKPTSTATLWKLPGSSTTSFGSTAGQTQAFQNLTGQSASREVLAASGHIAAISTFDSVTRLVLDGLYREIRSGSHILLSRENEYRWFRITKVFEVMRELSGEATSQLRGATGAVVGSITTPPVTTPVTILHLDADLNKKGRSTLATPADWPASNPEDITVHHGLIEGGTVTVEARTSLGPTDPLTATGALELPGSTAPPGRFLLEDLNNEGLLVTGTLNFNNGSLALDQTAWDKSLAAPVKLYGNLIKASRGESVKAELLGSGDASLANQQFKLAKKPLTYVLSPTSSGESGTASTLRVYVNGVLWSEVSSFFGVPSDAQVYIARQNDGGESIITFGDGVRGSRLPSGTDNVIADYRYGAGAASPPAGSINQLAKPAQGLKSVRNPVAASGGRDAEESAGLRTYAPRSALLLGRAVSIQDVEAAAAAQGVRAVSAEWRWSGTKQRPLVHVYYIGEPGIESKLAQTLRALMDPATPIRVSSATAVARSISLDIEIHPRFLEGDVLAAVREGLMNTETGLLAPERIGIGKPLYRSRIFETVIAVAGTLAVRALLIDGVDFQDFAISPGSGNYFDFEVGAVLLNGKAGGNG